MWNELLVCTSGKQRKSFVASHVSWGQHQGGTFCCTGMLKNVENLVSMRLLRHTAWRHSAVTHVLGDFRRHHVCCFRVSFFSNVKRRTWDTSCVNLVFLRTFQSVRIFNKLDLETNCFLFSDSVWDQQSDQSEVPVQLQSSVTQDIHPAGGGSTSERGLRSGCARVKACCARDRTCCTRVRTCCTRVRTCCARIWTCGPWLGLGCTRVTIGNPWRATLFLTTISPDTTSPTGAAPAAPASPGYPALHSRIPRHNQPRHHRRTHRGRNAIPQRATPANGGEPAAEADLYRLSGATTAAQSLRQRIPQSWG